MGGAFIQGETERAAKKGPFKIIPFEETGLFCNPPQTGEGALGQKKMSKSKKCNGEIIGCCSNLQSPKSAIYATLPLPIMTSSNMQQAICQTSNLL